MKSRALWVVLLVAAARAGEPALPPAPLAFRIDEGQNLNYFLRDGAVAAHLLLRNGDQPRILVAFPAGNGGIGLWFEKPPAPNHWTLRSPPRAFAALDGQRRPLRGIEFEIEARVSELRARAAVLSSIRVLRDFELQAKSPGEVLVPPRVGAAGLISWTRDRLDGAAGFQLSIEAGEGVRVAADRFVAPPGQPLRLRIWALSGEPPLTPVADVLTRDAHDDPRARDVLAFLSYREKFLAGSWRFDTYFGRDTLISALLLAPVLQPDAIESAIASVLDRLAPNGEVAHEEDIGEFAVLRNAREGRGRIATPIYDYGMVDDDFLLLPLAARWLLDDQRGRARARAFLDAHGAGLTRNLQWVVARTAAFARDPRVANLVGLQDGRNTGNWRDSEQGLGQGRYAYDINAALVPAALDAAARFIDSRLLDEWLGAQQRRTAGAVRAAAGTWAERAPAFFAVDVPRARARTALLDYTKAAGVDGTAALRALPRALKFHALSLDGNGRPIPILHSDEGFRLLLTNPSATGLERCIDAILRPFPAGLMTDAGMLVANPMLAPRELQRAFTRYDYHGTVVWSWQQALFAAGLERQLARHDLPEATRARLRAARTALRAVIANARGVRTSELWSWSFDQGRYRIEPFGRPGTDVDESNAAQLWSTVFLGITTGTSPVD
jgi:hypothetical protein